MNRILLSLILLLILNPPAATAQDSCQLEEVKIGFQGETCAFWDYSITLNGAEATGFGNGCLSFEQFPNLTDKAWTKLRLNQTYTVTAGSGLCITHINFDVPEGYELYINGIESKTISKTDGGEQFSGDGQWSVVVRKKCPCPEDAPGQAKTKNCSVIWDAGLGRLGDGRSAERLSIREKQLTSAIYTPAGLVYSPPGQTSEVDVVKIGGILRQVKVPQTLADIFVISTTEYEIRYYQPSDVGLKQNGVYTVTGQPYVKWNIKNPNPGSFSKLEISKIEGGIATDKTEYTWDAAIDSWTMRTGWSETQGYARTEIKTITYPTPTARTETFVVKGSDGIIVSRKTKTYLSYPWGEELVQEVSDPEGAALTTTYTYFESPTETHRYQKLKTVTFPDGSWEKYDYDIYWNISKIIRPWKDLSLANATESNSHVTIFGYTNSDNGVFGISKFLRILWDVEEKINGVTVRKSRYLRSIAGVDPDMISVTDSSYSGSNNGVPVNLIGSSVTTTYRFSAPEFLANRVAAQVHENGTKDAYTYEQGNYVPNADPSLSVFIPDVNGAAERRALVHGTSTSPDGIAFKTTRETSVRDQFGNIVLEETYVYNGAGYERIAWTVNDFDTRGHILTTRNSRGEVSTTVWVGDHKSSEINTAGVETTYEYDSLDRLKKQTKKGIAAGGGFPLQPDIISSFEYDAEGRPKTSTLGEGAGSLIDRQVYDRAGRLTQQTDPAGLTTSYVYSNGGRTQTVSRPGGATEITDNYLDRQIKSLTGTALVARYFDYGVNVDGTRYVQEFSGSGGLTSPRSTKTTRDWMGRTVIVEMPSFTGISVLKTLFYNLLGQLQKETITSNSTKAIADRLFEYDELGRPVRSGFDIDNSSMLTAASTDRLSETDGSFEKVGSDWFYVRTSRAYLVDNNSTAVTQTERERLNNFPLNGSDQTVSEFTLTDVVGNETKTTTVVNRAVKKETTTVDTPQSNLNAVSIRVNGLLQSSTDTTPHATTTYSYDSFGRQIGVTDPGRSTQTRTFSSVGQLASINDGAGTTLYEFYPAAHVNAGLLKSRTNAAGKKTYFAYNSRSQLVETWGDAGYPLKYVYDNYGQQTELHSFRTGQNWSASMWPSATTGAADVTKWFYQEATGLMTQKQDAALKTTTYTYDELGRTKTRVWARGITCTYGYDANTGELRTTTYSDSTPAVSLTYDRGGRQTGITDAAGSHVRTFNVAGELQSDQITGGILEGVGVTVGFDSFLRRQSLQTTHGANTISSQSYGYDISSRLQTVSSGSQTATYAYHTGSGLLNTTTFTGGSNIARSYDSIGRLENITTTPSAAGAQSYNYINNNLNQRTRVTREDGSYWSYSYNDRGELISGRKYWADNSIVWGAQNEYSFDNIGNRKLAKVGGNQLGLLRESVHTANSLNQYTQRTVPGAVDVAGTANVNAAVSVNNTPSIRKGEYFYKELPVDNTGGPVSQEITVVGARNNFGAGGEDAITQKGGREFLPPSIEAFTYDDDGNLLSDGRWVYTWDGENNLLSMQAGAAVPDAAKTRLEFAYDYARRRIQKKIYVWDVPASTYTLQSVRKFVYDGFHLIAELDATFATLRRFAWGQDVGGGLQTIGGIGGLLLISEGGNTYQVFYDGNGNVGGVVNAATGTLSGSYEYDPFGRILKSVGDYARQNAFKFSTKYTDEETGLVYYGYRYYQPDTGKWIGRDPIAEEGGVNLSVFNSNDPVNKVDALGLYEIDMHYYLTYFLASQHHCLSKQEANDISNYDQGTDEREATWPGPGWFNIPGDETDAVVPGGTISLANSYLADKGLTPLNNNDYQQQGQNIYYHALHPGAAEGQGNRHLWEEVMRKCDAFKEFGQYLHYLQDTFAHSGYTSPKCGHGCEDQHLPDHTIVDPPKALRAAKATWKALNDFAQRVKCDCQASWNPAWDQTILEFAGVGFESNIKRRAFEGSDRDLDVKRRILGLSTRYPNGGLRTQR
jgi:RHS repeat-associated protein